MNIEDLILKLKFELTKLSGEENPIVSIELRAGSHKSLMWYLRKYDSGYVPPTVGKLFGIELKRIHEDEKLFRIIELKFERRRLRNEIETWKHAAKSDYETTLRLNDELKGVKAEAARLRKALENIIGFDRARGYPTGHEWMSIIDLAKEEIAKC